MNYFNNDIRELFINHYVIYVYLSCLGTLQVVSAISHLRGMMIFSNRRINIMLGIIFIAGGFIFFFASPIFLNAEWIDSGLEKATLQNFASVRNVNDISKLKKIRCFGVIIGKAIYENKIDLKELC